MRQKVRKWTSVHWKVDDDGVRQAHISSTEEELGKFDTKSVLMKSITLCVMDIGFPITSISQV